MCAIARPRSSLLRMGVTVETAVWDAGYRGRSEALLIVYNSAGFYIKKDARVVQLIFMRMENAVQQGYSGRYRTRTFDMRARWPRRPRRIQATDSRKPFVALCPRALRVNVFGGSSLTTNRVPC